MEKRVKLDSQEDEGHLTTTTTTTTSTIEESEIVNQVEETTIFCDECGKARIIANEVLEAYDLSKKWDCSIAGIDCSKPDDELINIVGEIFAKVLDTIGIRTRKDLAASRSEEYDSGPWEAYILNWIQTAKELEIFDAMVTIFEDKELIHELTTLAEISNPVEFLNMDEVEFTTILNEVLARGDLEEKIPIWKAQARSLVDSMPWMIGDE